MQGKSSESQQREQESSGNLNLDKSREQTGVICSSDTQRSRLVLAGPVKPQVEQGG
jgi:hypothetical protein